MRAGKLRKLITIQQPVTTQTGTGNPRPSWANFPGAVNIYAEVIEAGGREQLQAGQVNPQQPISVRIRYVPGITPKMRVLYSARVFEIMTVTNVVERNRELDLACLEHQ